MINLDKLSETRRNIADNPSNPPFQYAKHEKKSFEYNPTHTNYNWNTMSKEGLKHFNEQVASLTAARSIIETSNTFLYTVATDKKTPAFALAMLVANDRDWKISVYALTNPTFLAEANEDEDLLRVFKAAVMNNMPRIEDLERTMKAKLPEDPEVFNDLFGKAFDIKSAIQGYPKLVEAMKTILTFG